MLTLELGVYLDLVTFMQLTMPHSCLRGHHLNLFLLPEDRSLLTPLLQEGQPHLGGGRSHHLTGQSVVVELSHCRGRRGLSLRGPGPFTL